MSESFELSPSMEEYTWSILGAGSIGCLLAYQFSMNSIACQLLLRDTNHLESYQLAGGITLLSSNNLKGRLAHQIQVPLPAKAPESFLPQSKPISHLFITTKANQTEIALQAYADHISPTATIIMLQNGMGNTEIIKHTLPQADVIIGTTTEGANRSAPFTISHAGKGVTWLGPSEKSINVPIQLAPLKTLMNAGFNVHWDPLIELRLWQKLAINCAINGLTIIHNCENGFLLKNPKSKADLFALIDEITQFYEQHIPEAADNLKQSIVNVIMTTDHNISSSLQDWRLGKETELPYINGYLINYAKSLNVELPLNQKLMRDITARNPPRKP